MIEDYARFAVEDLDACSTCKGLRHRLGDLRARLGINPLLSARATESDVGRDRPHTNETLREDLQSIVGSAFGRLSQSLRSIAELSKLCDSDVAATAETMRFDGYALEARVRLRSKALRHFRAAGLYLVVSEAACRADWFESTRAALLGGLRVVQLREKSLPDHELLDRARRLRELTRAHDALFCMNDRPDLARLSQADLLHVGQDDLPIAEARRIAGSGMLVGQSTHDQSQIDAALRQRPDYLAIGPIFQSRTKPQPRLAGLEALRNARPSTRAPLVAIGGIERDNVAGVVQAGADLVCVCSAVLGSDCPRSATEQLLQAIAAARRESAPLPEFP